MTQHCLKEAHARFFEDIGSERVTTYCDPSLMVVPGHLDWDLETGGSPHNVGLTQKICQVSPKSGRFRPSVLPEDR